LHHGFAPPTTTQLITTSPLKSSTDRSRKFVELQHRDNEAPKSSTSAPGIVHLDLSQQSKRVNLEGTEAHISQTTRLRSKMEVDDLTQRSSMSLTQENSASAYAPFRGVSIQGFQPTQKSSSTPHSHSSRIHKTPAVTDSTPYTYQPDDTGHVTLGLEETTDPPLSQVSRDDEECENSDSSQKNGYVEEAEECENSDSSQKNGYVEEAEEFSSSQPRLEPQTPAPAINPFANRGSVMKGIDMFGATQPSSVAQRYTSPTSSRPSPNLYNNFATPAPYRTASSPLVHYNETPVPSLRDIPSQRSPQKGSRSLDGLFTKQKKILPDPRSYNSMKESQERRRHDPSPGPSSDDSDIEAESSYLQKQKRARKIQQTLSDVEFPGKLPTSPSPEVVEVPSTSSKRRLSRDEEAYLAQCSGLDARDTQENDLQQKDIIVDSQSLPGKAEVAVDCPTQASSNPHPDAEPGAEASLTQSLPGSAHGDIPDTLVDNPKAVSEWSPSPPHLLPDTLVHNPEAVPERTPSPPNLPHGHPSQSLPIMPVQEVSLNRDTSIVSAGKNQTEAAEGSAVPETSPVHNSIRPMGEIGLSFEQNDDDQAMELGNIPGFSQDAGFEQAMKMQASPEPMRIQKSRKVRKPVVEIEKLSFAVPASSGAENFSTAADTGVESSAPKLNSSKPATGAGTVDTSRVFHELAAKPLQTQAPRATVAEKVSINITSNVPDKPQNAGKAASILGKNSSKVPLKVTLITIPDTVLHKSAPLVAVESEPLVLAQVNLGDISGGPDAESDNVSKASSNTITRKGVQISITKLDIPHTSVQKAVLPLSAVASTASSMLSSAPASSVSTPQTDELSSTRNQPPAKARGRSTKGRPKKSDQKVKTKVYKIKAAKNAGLDEPTRSSKRVGSLRGPRDSSDDPIAMPNMSAKGRRSSSRLFTGMTFAVSCEDSGEKAMIVKHIAENGGELLEEGFVGLFDAGPQPGKDIKPTLNVATHNRSLGFTAVIANEYSRKPKYMQALALGLPCLSVHWILSCVCKGIIVDWKPYLLSAGQSILLSNASLSRHLTSYPNATDASLVICIGERTRIFDGLSILAVGCKGVVDEKLELFSFLCWVTGPSRFCQVPSYEDARKKLLDDEVRGIKWDLVFCDANRKTVGAALFSNTNSKKRKRTSTAAVEAAPKKIRIIDKEDLLQSLIIGQLVED
jgi:hypothetical protein